MEANDDDSFKVNPNIDYTKILPIQQKRTIAFINNFVLNTVDFLNKFAQSCESRLFDFEDKLQNVEASLLILEAQLSSISGLENEENKPKNEPKNRNEIISDAVLENLPEIQETETIREKDGKQAQPLANEDPRFKRFFKMLQFGVPAPAVKLKMQTEGVDPTILDTPSAMIPGYIPEVIEKALLK